MRTILCYGDSNTWGFVPGAFNPDTFYMERYPLSKRWPGAAALEAGIVQGTGSIDEISEIALKKAEELAPLANDRKIFGAQKEMLYGKSAAINTTHGPAHMLKNSKEFE